MRAALTTIERASPRRLLSDHCQARLIVGGGVKQQSRFGHHSAPAPSSVR